MCASLWKLWPSPRFVAPVGPDRALPFPRLHVARANVAARGTCRYVSTTCTSTDEKIDEVRDLRRRVANDRFASVIRPVLCDVRLSMTPPQPRRTHWLSPAASTSRCAAGRFFDFPSPSPTGSNRFAVTGLLQWPCHARRSAVAQGICEHARLMPFFSPPCHISDDSYTRRSARPRLRENRQLNSWNTRFI